MILHLKLSASERDRESLCVSRVIGTVGAVLSLGREEAGSNPEVVIVFFRCDPQL